MSSPCCRPRCCSRRSAKAKPPRALDQLEELIKRPEPQTTLVLVATSVDKRGRMFKLLQKHAVVVECGALEDLADAERWVRTRIAAAGADRSRRRRGSSPSAPAST